MKRLAQLLSTLFFLTQALAVPVNNLYQAQVSVASQSVSLRQAAISQGLQDVLTKVSGSSTVTSADKANTYLQQYSYQRNRDKTASLPWLLNLQFQPTAINQLLRKAGQRVWGKDRPLVLAWVALSANNTRQLIAADSAEPLATTLQSVASKRGLPLLLPVLDMTDITQVSPNDVWGGFLDPIKAASTRYTPNAILLAQLTQQSPTDWQSQWTLIVGDEQQQWQVDAADQASVVQQGMDNVIDAIAQRYALIGQGSDESVSMTVTGVDNLVRFHRIQQYLQQLAPVQQVTLAQAKGDQVQFTLRLQGTQQDLQQAIKLDSSLQSLGFDAQTDTLAAQLIYHLHE